MTRKVTTPSLLHSFVTPLYSPWVSFLFQTVLLLTLMSPCLLHMKEHAVHFCTSESGIQHSTLIPGPSTSLLMRTSHPSLSLSNAPLCLVCI